MNASHHTAAADQLAAQVRDARCCDALAPCHTCRRLAMTACTHRHLARVAQAQVSGSAASDVSDMSRSAA